MKFSTFGATLLLTAAALARAGDEPGAGDEDIIVKTANGLGEVSFDQNTGVATAEGGVTVVYRDATLTARSVRAETGQHLLIATGDVTIIHHSKQGGAQVWRGETVQYNYVTKAISADAFRFGQPPFFASGNHLQGIATNTAQTATMALVTTDDIAEPGYKVKARSLTIGPKNRISADDAVMYFGDMPVMYFPHYVRDREQEPDYWTFIPGYRSAYGPFLLSSYHYNWSTNLETYLKFDYRERRGFAGGPGVNYDLGDWGAGHAEGYYARDHLPGLDPYTNAIPRNRYYADFDHQVEVGDSFSAKAVVHDLSDIYVTHDFTEGAYRRDTQPKTFFEADKTWSNFTLNTLVEPQINSFFRTVERLPDVQLTGLRQEVGQTPIFYESQSSLAYLSYRDGLLPAGTVSTNFSALRADTLHQLLLPETFFGWLNLTPRIGGRYTYYTDPSGLEAINSARDRWVFNTGAELSFKASQIWPTVHNDLLDVDGIRHIIEPSINYVFVPRPSTTPLNLPQFDTELPSYRLLPITYPDYNSIDSVDSQNTLRFGLNNKLQTKRDGQVEDLLNWSAYTDWRLQPRPGQTTFPDLYSDMDFSPRRWLILNSTVRYNINGQRWDELYHRLTIEPNETWSWTLGHRYLVDDPLTYGQGNNLFISHFRYRINEDWGFRLIHQYEARTGTMQEQYYTVYRDLRSWTVALTVRRRQNLTAGSDWSVVLTFQLKAFPKFKLNSDQEVPERLLGG